MNTKILLGFLAGLLVATGVFYVQSHRNAKVQTPAAVAVVPPVAPAPAPLVETAPPSITQQAAKKAPEPARNVVAKKIAKPAGPEAAPALIEQAKVVAAPTPEPAPAPAPVVAPEPPPPPSPPPSAPPSEAKLEPPQPRSVTIATGALLNVRLGETISTERSRQGDSFVATLDEPLVVDGLVIAEKGARANGRVVDALEAGRVKGLAHLSLELTSVMLSDGQKIELRTGRFEKQGPSSKAEDGKKVGIGAAIGAAIGAIAGGGTGAAIGAATGGAAGGGVVAATRGKPAVLTAETKISFRVEQPVTITERR